MKRGTLIEAIVIDPAGLLSLRAGQTTYRGTLLDEQGELAFGQLVRLRVELEHLAGEPPSFDLTVTVVGRVLPVHDRMPSAPGLELINDTCFVIEVLQVSRGLMWENAGERPEEVTRPSVAAPRPEGLERCVDVVAADGTGELELWWESRRFDGWLVHLPSELSRGLELHIRVTVPRSPSTAGEETIDLLGVVAAAERADGRSEPLPYSSGARFSFAVKRHSAGQIPFPVLSPGEIAFLVASLERDGAADTPLPLASTQDPSVTSPDPGDSEMAVHHPEPSGIIGSLRQMSLVDLVQSLELNRKTCRIDLAGVSRADAGTLYLEGGQLSAAYTRGNEGEEAFLELARLDEGTFRVRFEAEPQESNIDQPTTYLILESLRQIDEAGAGDILTPAPIELPGIEEITVPTVPAPRVVSQLPVFSRFFEEAAEDAQSQSDHIVINADFVPSFSVPTVTVDELVESLSAEGGVGPLLETWSFTPSTPPRPA